ncbi:MAG: hypothetical protein ACI86C_001542 [Candidatus Latescibacterota bacterium]|jgi:hypothetical protein
MKVHYLNTDLELESPRDLTPIVEEFGEDVSVLFNGEARGIYIASFEVAGSFGGPEGIIEFFCMLAETLEGEAKELWDGCYSKKLNIGYEGGVSHQSYESTICSGTIERMAKNGASLGITVYPMTNETST